MMRMKQTKRLLLLALTMALFFMMSFSADAAPLSVTKKQVSYPTTFKSGSTFTMKGTLESNKIMTKVITTIYDSAGTKCLQRYEAKPNNVKYDLSKSDSRLHFEKLPVGKYYYRIAVIDATNTKLRVLDKPFTVTKGETMKITKTQVAVPGTLKQGTKFKLSGTISTNLPMKSVVFTIYNGAGTKRLQKYTATVNGKVYNIANASSFLSFNKLAPGSYYYRISVYDMKNKKTRITNKKFTVTASSVTPTPTPTTSSIKISSPKPATSITMRQGSQFGLGGTITSTKKLATVKAELINQKKEKVYTATVKPNATTFKLAGSELDKKMVFEKLKPGMYTLAISATDTAGKKAVVINRSFFITGTYSGFAIVNPTPATDTTISRGTYYSISGRIDSKLNIKNIRATLSNSSGKVLFEGIDTPNTKQYHLGGSKIDNAIKFNQLGAGVYYLNIFVTDADGSIAPIISKKITVK